MAERGKTKPKRGGHACAAYSCSNSQYKRDCLEKSFYRFPRDEMRCDIWMQNMRREDFQNQDTRPTYEQLYNNFRLCSDHFEDSQFTNPDKKRLVWNAVPTLFYVSNCPHPMTGKHLLPQERSKPPFKKAKCSDEVELPSPQEAQPDHQQLLPTQKKKLKNRVKHLQKKNHSLKNKGTTIKHSEKKGTTTKQSKKKMQKQETQARHRQLISDLSEYLSSSALFFVKTQVLLGYQWTEEDKRLALSVCHAGPKPYNMLRKVFALPSKSVLERVMNKITSEPEKKGEVMSREL